MLKGKHIVVGITGSIAAYKACTLIRTFIKKEPKCKLSSLLPEKNSSLR